MELIKSLNEQFKVKDPVELAFESVANPESDMARIAEHWRGLLGRHPADFGMEHPDAEPDQMGQKQLVAGIGDDLEQLEYSPEDVNRMVPQVMRMVLER